MLACIKANRTCIRKKLDDSVEFLLTNGEKFTLANTKVNLKNFLTKSKLQSDVKAMKPAVGKDWNEMLKCDVKSNKKPVFRVDK
jgi:hypothetical protein